MADNNRSQFNFNRRSMEENFSDFRNAVLGFIAEYGNLDGNLKMDLSAKFDHMAKYTDNIAQGYADGLMSYGRGEVTGWEAEYIKQEAQKIQQSIDNIRQNSADLFKQSAENYQAGKYATSASKVAGPLGYALSGAEIKSAYDEGVETGDYSKLGEAVAELFGGIVGAELGAMLGTALVATFLGAGAVGTAPFVVVAIAVAVTSWAVAEFFDWAFGDCLSDKFSDWFNNLNRDGNYFLYDPLVLDLDGDGVELIAENDWNGVLFDFNGNGIKTATQWLNGDDGLLVLDRNKNGKIDDGTELFGEDTIQKPTIDAIASFGGGASKPQEKDDGFDALRTVDSNLDGKINAKDSEWQNLRVWRDLNACNNEFFTKSSDFQAA